MPIFSNHTIIKNFFLLAVVLGGSRYAWRGDSWSDWFTAVAPVGRALLLIMYIFGVFHKLNSGFLDPNVSCAVDLWKSMPWPFYLVDGAWARYLFIYGTLVVESLIFVFLLVPALRHWGIVTGIAFHMMLALSSYAMYAPFSMLSLTLHALFLSSKSARAVMDDPITQAILRLSGSWRGWVLAGVYFAALRLFAWANIFWGVTVIWFLWAIPFSLRILPISKSSVSVVLLSFS